MLDMISELLPTKLLENLNTAVLMLDLDLKLSHINSAAENLLGLSGSRHIGESIEKNSFILRFHNGES